MRHYALLLGQKLFFGFDFGVADRRLVVGGSRSPLLEQPGKHLFVQALRHG